MLTDPLIHELLELVKTLQTGQRTITLGALADSLGCSNDVAERLLKTALKEGLVEPLGDTFRLTEKGKMEIQRHREHFIHNRHAHGSSLFGRAVRCLEGRIENWNDHWKHRHGLDNHSLTDFKGINDLQGRVEDLISLADLRQGGSGVVALTLGGRRLITRLAEMGLTPGTEVTVVRSAPLHGPIEVSVRGVSLALGGGVASKIFIKEQGKQSFVN